MQYSLTAAAKKLSISLFVSYAPNNAMLKPIDYNILEVYTAV